MRGPEPFFLGGLPGPEGLGAFGSEMALHKDKGPGPGEDLLQLFDPVTQNGRQLAA